MIQAVCHGSTQEEDVAFPHPPAEGGGYEDAPDSHGHLPALRKPETAAPRLYRSGRLRDIS